MIRTAPLKCTRPLRRSTFTLKTRQDSLLRLWAQCVRARDGDTCLRCRRGAPQWKVESAHILSRGSRPRLKYLVLNGIRLCFVCHRWYDEHKDESLAWVRRAIGEDRYQRLLAQAAIPRKHDPVMTAFFLTAQLRQLQGAGASASSRS